MRVYFKTSKKWEVFIRLKDYLAYNFLEYLKNYLAKKIECAA